MADNPDLREEIAAYLAGDLDASRVAHLEARMASEPWVASEADRMADLLVALGAVDDLPVPDGFSTRLHSALEDVIGSSVFRGAGATLGGEARPSAGQLASAGAAAADGWASADEAAGPRVSATGAGAGATIVSLAERQRGRRRFAMGLGVAASVAVLAIASLSVLSRSSDEAGDTASSADQDVAAGTAESARGGDDLGAAFSQAPSQDALDDDTAGGAATSTPQALPLTTEDGAAPLSGAPEDATAGTGPRDDPGGDGAALDDGAVAPEDGAAPDQSNTTAGGAAGSTSPGPSGPADDAADAEEEASADDGDAADEAAADESAPQAEGDAAQGAAPADSEGGDPPPGDDAPADSGAGPQVADFGDAEQDDAVARATGLPAVQRARDAEGDPSAVAAAYRDEILRSPPFDDGTEPGQCLQDVLGSNDEGVIPAVAVRHVTDGQTRLSYVLVSPDDDVRVWTVTAETCEVIAVVG